MHDGSIVFNTKIDNSDVEKDLKDLEKKIRSSEDSISNNQNAKLPLVKQAEQLGAKLDEAKRNLAYVRQEMTAVQEAMAPGSNPADYMAASADYERVKAALDAQDKEVQDLQKEWDKVNGKVEVYDRKIEASRAEIQRCTAEAGRLRSKLGKGGNSLSGIFDRAEKSANKFGKRILNIGMSAFVFNLLSSGLRSAVQHMDKCLQTNKQYTAQLASLKAALLTAFQPIYEFILPGLITIMKVLTSILTLFGRFLAWVTGKDYSQMVKNSQALYNQAGAIDAVGSAADKAAKSLASFDEINQIGDGTGVNSGGGAGGGITPDFGDLEGKTDSIAESLSDLLGLVAAIGAAFLAWKLASHFTDDLSKIAGIALTVGGAVMYAYSWMDAFANGIDWKNLIGMITGMAAVVGGLWLAFGKTGGAVGLLITGLGMLCVAINDWITTGELTTEALMTLELGFLAVGSAISLLTGSWIPLLIAAVVGLVVVIGTRADQIKQKLQQLDNWLTDIFTTDWRNTFGPVLGGILNGFCTVLQSVWATIKNRLEGWLDFLGGVFTGDWRKAWVGIKQIFCSSISPLSNVALDVMNAIVNAVRNAINWILDLISSINTAKSASNSKSRSNFGGFFAKGGTLRSGWGVVGEAGPEIIRLVGGKAVITPLEIPYLAQGAVLPANKPFMAMVGDQKYGTNIEAPLSTIQEAVATVVGDYTSAMTAGFEASVQKQQEILDAIMGIEIGDTTIGQAAMRHQRRQNYLNGGAAL